MNTALVGIILLLAALADELLVGLALSLPLGVWLLQRSFGRRVDALQQEITTLKKQLLVQTQAAADETATAADGEPAEHTPVHAQTATTEVAPPEEQALFSLDDPDEEPQQASSGALKRRFDRVLEHVLRKLSRVVTGYFTDGNIFVRVGLLVLFVGVAFLLKYAAQHSAIPLEFRFMGAALGGLGLVGFGWRQRRGKPAYALLLQGGGIGIVYITIFAAYRIAELIPPGLSFALLVAFSLVTAALAVLQNSRALAVYAVLGGFIAPFLASSDSGNYIGLFSYYALLNLLVFVVAWFKAWRLLNLLGFVFTFGVYALWFLFSYRQEMLLPAGAFLLLYFVLYSLLGVLYALKQTQDLRGLVDGTLVFGTPLIASSLAMAMLRHEAYGITGVCLGLGIYYVVLARLMWTRMGQSTRLLAESMLAIGVVFVTLAVPYALDGHWTSATWALEAAGILWVSLRQNRQYAQWFAVALQLGAGMLFLLRNADDIGQTAWINPAFLGGCFVALGALASARLLYLADTTSRLHRLHWLFFAWGLGWWLITALVQINQYIDQSVFATLLLFAGTAGLLLYLDRIRSWNWLPAAYSQAALLPVLYGVALGAFVDQSDGIYLVWPDVVGWGAALAVNYYLLTRLEELAWRRGFYLASYTGLVLLITVMLSLELDLRFFQLAANLGESFHALLAVVPLLIVWWTRQGSASLLRRFGLPLQQSISAVMLGYLALWSVGSNLFNNGDAHPLPFMPLLNPLDIVHLVMFIALIRSLRLAEQQPRDVRHGLQGGIGVLAFVWISALLLRAMHHYKGVAFDLDQMLLDPAVQTGLSILWTLIGMGTILFASRRSMRTLWLVGAALVAVVLVKLVFADLRASGTLERIVSFLVVGGLLTVTGYFSPIPPKRALQAETGVESGSGEQNG